MATINELLDIANDSVTRVDFDTANEMILNGAYIVDVREESEDAIHIPRGLIEFQLSAESTTNPLDINKDSDLLIYCAAGIRAALAAKTLQDLGFKNVYNLGGLSEWVSSGGAIEP